MSPKKKVSLPPSFLINSDNFFVCGRGMTREMTELWPSQHRASLPCPHHCMVILHQHAGINTCINALPSHHHRGQLSSIPHYPHHHPSCQDTAACCRVRSSIKHLPEVFGLWNGYAGVLVSIQVKTRAVGGWWPGYVMMLRDRRHTLCLTLKLTTF